MKKIAKQLLRLARNVVASSSEKEVEKLLGKLLNTPGFRVFKNKTYAVGGYVRDEFLGLEAKDLDIAVEMNGGAEALTKKIYSLFQKQVSLPRKMGDAYPIWQITFKRDIDYDDESYATKGAVIEFADTQKEKFPDPKSRQREVQYGTLDEDVKRRDFTVNMLMKDLRNQQIVDLTGVGKKDLETGILRSHPLVNPDQMFKDDPLRMLRLVRFQAKYGWSVPKFMIDSVRRVARSIENISQERIRDELVKIMKVGKLDMAIRFMSKTGLLPYVLPEIEAMKGVEHGKKHHWEGSEWTCSNFEPK